MSRKHVVIWSRGGKHVAKRVKRTRKVISHPSKKKAEKKVNIEQVMLCVSIAMLVLSIGIFVWVTNRPNTAESVATEYYEMTTAVVVIKPTERTTYDSPKAVKVVSTTENTVPQETKATSWRYEPTDEEFIYACKLAFAEAGCESSLGQTAVIEVALNAVEAGYADDIIGEFTRKGRYSPVKNGVPYVMDVDGYRPVRESDLSESLKEAVLMAFMGERPTEKLLEEMAIAKGLYNEKYWKGGALYFYNPEAISQEAKESRNESHMPVKIEIGHHTFARFWE